MPDDLIKLIAGMGGGIIALTCGITLVTTLITIVAIVLIRRAVGPNRGVLKSGIAGEATILSVRQTGVQVNDQPQVAFELEVRVPGRSPYQAQTKAVIPIINVPQFQPGNVIPVKVDPNKPDQVVFDVYG